MLFQLQGDLIGPLSFARPIAWTTAVLRSLWDGPRLSFELCGL